MTRSRRALLLGALPPLVVLGLLALLVTRYLRAQPGTAEGYLVAGIPGLLLVVLWGVLALPPPRHTAARVACAGAAMALAFVSAAGVTLLVDLALRGDQVQVLSCLVLGLLGSLSILPFARRPRAAIGVALALWCVAAALMLGLESWQRRIGESYLARWRASGWPASFSEIHPAAAEESGCAPIFAALQAASAAPSASRDAVGSAYKAALAALERGQDPAPVLAPDAVALRAAIAASGVDPTALTLSLGSCPRIAWSTPAQLEQLGPDTLLGKRGQVAVGWAKAATLSAILPSAEPADPVADALDPALSCEAVLRLGAALSQGAQLDVDHLWSLAVDGLAASCYSLLLMAGRGPLPATSIDLVGERLREDHSASLAACDGEKLYAARSCSGDFVARFALDAELARTLGLPPDPPWQGVEPLVRIRALGECQRTLADLTLWRDWLARAPRPELGRFLWAEAPDLPRGAAGGGWRHGYGRLLLVRARLALVLAADAALRGTLAANALPVDPFRDGPLDAAREPDGHLRLWSVGPDGRSEGAVALSGFGSSYQDLAVGGDTGLRLRAAPGAWP